MSVAKKITDELVASVSEIYRKKWPKFEVCGSPVMTKEESVRCINGIPDSIKVELSLTIYFWKKGTKRFYEFGDFSIPFPDLIGYVKDERKPRKRKK